MLSNKSIALIEADFKKINVGIKFFDLQDFYDFEKLRFQRNSFDIKYKVINSRLFTTDQFRLGLEMLHMINHPDKYPSLNSEELEFIKENLNIQNNFIKEKKISLKIAFFIDNEENSTILNQFLLDHPGVEKVTALSHFLSKHSLLNRPSPHSWLNDIEAEELQNTSEKLFANENKPSVDLSRH